MSLLGVITPVIAVLGAAIAGTDRRIARALRDAGALSPDTAVALPPRRRPIWRWRLQRMERAGAIRRTSGESLYLDEPGWAAYRTSRRRRVLIALSIAIPLMLLVIFLSGGH